MEKQLQPKLRFSEFVGEWESNYLKTLTTLLKDGSHGTHVDVLDSEYLLLSAKNVQNGKILLSDNERKISKLDFSQIYKNYKLIEGDLLLSIVGSIGRVAIFKSEYNKCAFQRSVAFLRFEKEIPEFIFQLFHSKHFQNQLKVRQVVSAQPGIYLNDLSKILIKFPSLPEQQKIADYLSTIDNKLTLLEEKKTELSRYKKAMMQKLFSQEIRFKDENGNDFSDWEEKCLGEVFNSFNGLTGKTKENFGFGKSYIKYTQVFNDSKINIQNFDLVEITENDKQNIVEFGDAFFTVSSETPHEVGMSSVLLDSVEEVYLNSFCFGIRPISKNLNPYYYRYFFRSKNFRKEVVKLAQGSTRYNMSKVEFMKINIQIPSLPEQQKIADFLSGIDESIAKVSEQIKETQNFKKAMLQQMFV